MEGGKQRIQENMDELVNKIDCCPLFPFFRLKKIFSQRSVNEIQQYSDKRRRNFEVLTNVYRRSASVFNSFVDVLWMSGQRDAARILKPECVTVN
ncbi:hypothetical protein B4U80_13584 [Leptotrombidium deliense]|uniref:Uncharacterized protein n=1 Tax=Leptotrombidium deliense TaxID=299467 RepID=A0A443SWN7_9ACAR|nr:hypothetical protein B4U80_13584 [Leptotrombidium deliense]